jgi:subtilisin family serine protease
MLKRLPGGHARLLGAALAVSLFAMAGVPNAAAAAPPQPMERGSGPARGAWLVEFREDVDDATAARVMAAAGVTRIGGLDDLGVRVVHVPRGREAAVAALARDPRVVSVEQDAQASVTRVPTDPRWPRQWGMRKIRAPEAWDRTVGRSSAVIAIIDTGVDRYQPDLRGRVMAGWDFHNNDSNPADDYGHGTAVAGVAAAAGNNGIGIAGVCWNCRILPVKVLSANGSGSHSNIAAGIVWAVKNGADVINLSIAGPSSTTAMSSAIDFALRRGVVVVGAAGNEGSKRKFYPAAHPGVLSVAATDSSDRLYGWSNRGSWVRLAAPGCALTTKPRRRWSVWCGTSFATPVVAGTAALMKSIRPRMPRAEIEGALMRRSVNIRGVTDGRVDAARAVSAAAGWSPPEPPAPDPSPTPESPPATSSSYSWGGDLGPYDLSDPKTVSLSGRVGIDVSWNNDDHLWVSVADASGNVLAAANGEQALSLVVDAVAGTYRVTIWHATDKRTWYRVRIEEAG